MINTLYLPELREMLSQESKAELEEFCSALLPARTAEFMEGLTSQESWAVLRHAESAARSEIFCYLDPDLQIEIIESENRGEIALLIAELPPDDRVDLLKAVDAGIVSELLPLLPAEERRDIIRLRAYPEETAGAEMTTEAAKLFESLTVADALDEIRRQSEELETIYYLYIVDKEDHLRGIVSAKQLITSMGKKDVTLGDLMESDVVSVNVADDREEVAKKVARYNLLAIPVVDDQNRMLGIITHDDVVDVLRDEAIEDAQLSVAINPLEEDYLRIGLVRLAWKRGVWLGILFFAAILTAFALRYYEDPLNEWTWLMLFLPLIISCGGNTGNQSATLIITSMTAGHISQSDTRRVLLRELAVGLMLGGFLALCGLLIAWTVSPDDINTYRAILVVPLTLLLIVVSGAMVGSTLPLLFQRLGFDPALMSNPFVAGIIDIAGIVIYMNVAMALLG